MNKKVALIILSALLAMCIVLPVYGVSDTSTATFRGTITVSNNSTAETNVATVFTANVTSMMANGHINSNVNNTAIVTSSGADVAYMPSPEDDETWCLFVPSIGAETYSSDIFYMGGADDMGGELRYFPDTGGMTTPDNDASLELGDTFTIEQKGWVQTAFPSGNYTDRNLVSKPPMFRTHISGSGNITTILYGGFDNFSIDDWTDVGAGVGVNIATERLEYDVVGGDHRSYRDFGTGNISDTLWQMDFTWYPDTQDANAFFGFGIGDILDNLDGYAGDALFFYFVNGVDCHIRRLDGGVVATSGAITVALDTTYYVTLERTSATGAKLSIFSDFERTTHVAGSPVTLVIPNTVVGLRYITASSYNGAVGTSKGWFDDLWLADLPDSWNTSVTVADIASGEYTITTAMDSPFLGLGVDASSFALPATANLAMNAPLWQTELDGSPFDTIDATEYTCTVNGATWSSEGRYFDGNDYIDLGDTFQAICQGSFTVEGWVRPDDGQAGSLQFLLGAQNVAAEDRVLLYILSTGQLKAIYESNDNEASATTSAAVFSDGQETWHHCVAVFDSTISGVGGIKIYFDGSVQTLAVAPDDGDTSGVTFANFAIVDNLYLGARNNNGVAQLFLTGDEGEARIYSQALTPTEVLQNYNATKFKYTSGDIYIYSTLASVPDNSENWAFVENESMLYMESHEIEIDGAQAQFIEWEYDTVFTDQSINSNDATPTFRSASSDPDVSASLSAWLPISEADAPAYLLAEAPDFITETPEMTGNFTIAVTPTYPGRDVVQAVAIAGAVPETLVTVLFSTFALIVVSLCLSYMLKTTGVNSLFIKSSIIVAIMAIFVAVQIYEVWQVYFFAMIALAATWMSRQREAY